MLVLVCIDEGGYLYLFMAIEHSGVCQRKICEA